MSYQIGAFSRITSLTVKTLRYYHEVGLLEPSKIDNESGYRYYESEQIVDANLIRLLKSYEFSIKEIKEILEDYEDESDIGAYLDQRFEQIEEKVKHYEELKNKIVNYRSYEENVVMSTEQVIGKIIEDKKIISLTYVGKYSDVGPYIGKLYRVAGSSIVGKPFCIYHDLEYKEEAKIQVCVAVKKEINNGTVGYSVLKGGKAVTLIHVGSYENLGNSYKRIADYMSENNLSSSIPSRELYLKEPGMLLRGNPKKYRTELQYMVD